MKYSVVVPVYNAEKSLDELVKRIIEIFETSIKDPFEIVLVDDASTDSSWDKLEKIYDDNKETVKIIQLMRNSGQHNATLCGLSFAGGDYVITIDDDLQHPPEEIPKLVDFMKSNPRYDVIMAIPAQRKHSFFRNISSYLLDKLLNLAISKPSKIRLSSFRIMNRTLRNAILSYKGTNATINSFICKLTDRIANLEVKHDYKKYGGSRYSLNKLTQLALNNIFNFSALPLKFISWLGFLTSIFAICLTILYLFRKMTGQIGQPGFATIVIMICLFSGLILFSFGIIGKYIIIIMNNLNVNEQFLIRKKELGSEKEHERA